MKEPKPTICIIGGGMITQVQLLPGLYQLQREGLVGDIQVCALDSGPLRELAEDAFLKKTFPGQSFTSYPSLETDPKEMFPDLYKEVLGKLPAQSIVVVALPDMLHYQAIKEALQCGQHVCSVKPLVMRHDQAMEVKELAWSKGLMVGVEYHKRMDPRVLIARGKYRQGVFGEFRIGHAEMNEPYYYRHSNFQNWCTCENSDMFTYVGCHYVDQVHFITGLLPTAVSVYGIKDRYPNGREGYLWTDARVIWENGACLSVTNIMGYPDAGPGSNYQGIRMYFAGKDRSGMLVHHDQNRGIEYCTIEEDDQPGHVRYRQPSPDYLSYVPVNIGGAGLVPVGYGYESIKYVIQNIHRCIQAGEKKQRQEIIRGVDQEGIMATPANSSYNELVTEAGRLSIQNGGQKAVIQYDKDHPTVRLV